MGFERFDVTVAALLSTGTRRPPGPRNPHRARSHGVIQRGIDSYQTYHITWDFTGARASLFAGGPRPSARDRDGAGRRNRPAAGRRRSEAGARLARPTCCEEVPHEPARLVDWAALLTGWASAARGAEPMARNYWMLEGGRLWYSGGDLAIEARLPQGSSR